MDGSLQCLRCVRKILLVGGYDVQTSANINNLNEMGLFPIKTGGCITINA